MGKLRRISDEWELDDKRSRDTLMPCPECKGNGTVIVEHNTGYMGKQCIWCKGVGGVTKHVARAHARWMRIRRANHC